MLHEYWKTLLVRFWAPATHRMHILWIHLSTPSMATLMAAALPVLMCACEVTHMPKSNAQPYMHVCMYACLCECIEIPTKLHAYNHTYTHAFQWKNVAMGLKAAFRVMRALECHWKLVGKVKSKCAAPQLLVCCVCESFRWLNKPLTTPQCRRLQTYVSGSDTHTIGTITNSNV